VQATLRQLVPTSPDLAVDGIDEVLTTIVAAKLDSDVSNTASGVAVVRPVDVPESWHVAFSPGEVPEVRAAAPGEEGDASVSGEAELLYYWLWNRMTINTASGDSQLLQVLQVGKGH